MKNGSNIVNRKLLSVQSGQPGSQAATPWKMDADSRLVLAWILYYIGLYWPLYTHIYKVLTTPTYQHADFTFSTFIQFSQSISQSVSCSNIWIIPMIEPCRRGLVIWIISIQRETTGLVMTVNHQHSRYLSLITKCLTVVVVNFPSSQSYGEALNDVNCGGGGVM